MGYQLWTSPIAGYRRNGTRFSALRKIFVDNVTAKNIFEPLFSCPANSPAWKAKKALKILDFDVAGIKDTIGGEVIGYVVTDEIRNGKLNNFVKKIDPDLLISDSTPIADIFKALGSRNFAFVLFGRQIIGIITKADINKPPIRIYLFGMISLFEMHLNFWINHLYPENVWKSKIPANRMKCARDIYEERKVINQDLSLSECLQFCDKRDILKKSKDFIKEFNTTKNSFYDLVKRSEKIRNLLSHSQNSIISDIEWPVFVETLSDIEIFLTNSDAKVECKSSDGNYYLDIPV